MASILRRIDEVVDLQGKTLLVRIDSDVKVDEGTIRDDTRLSVSLPTIQYLLDQGAKVILCGHMRRPSQKVNLGTAITDGIKQELSLEVIAHWFAEKLNGHVEGVTIGKFPGWQITDNVSLLENLRFFSGEEENDPEFSKELAALATIFVNDSFASSHRAHASVAGVSSLLPSYAGIHLADEIEVLSRAIENPKRPLVVLIGGAKIETKLPLVERMHRIADYVLVGGKIAENVKELIQVQHEELAGKRSMVFIADLTPDGKNITEKSTENFIQVVEDAGTVIWNGPMGLIEEEQYQESTKLIAEAVIKSGAESIIGGGDSISFFNKLGILDKFSFYSMGGGAMLEYLAGKELPGITPLLASSPQVR